KAETNDHNRGQTSLHNKLLTVGVSIAVSLPEPPVTYVQCHQQAQGLYRLDVTTEESEAR
ncbi:MAG TPA: hypothetical protein VE133_17655, partial [Candidatus Sulfotelmatobacter sp.]|nr:hypothetical protein [Candidatus Sulfotelmatobacter sp.]